MASLDPAAAKQLGVELAGLIEPLSRGKATWFLKQAGDATALALAAPSCVKVPAGYVVMVELSKDELRNLQLAVAAALAAEG